jgi:hypothetical protein
LADDLRADFLAPERFAVDLRAEVFLAPERFADDFLAPDFFALERRVDFLALLFFVVIVVVSSTGVEHSAIPRWIAERTATPRTGARPHRHRLY